MERNKFSESTRMVVWLALFSVTLAQQLVVYESWTVWEDTGLNITDNRACTQWSTRFGTRLFEKYGWTNEGTRKFECAHGHISFSGPVSVPIEIDSSFRLVVADGRPPEYPGCSVTATVGDVVLWDGSVDGLIDAPIPAGVSDPEHPALLVVGGSYRLPAGSRLRLDATGLCRTRLYAYRLFGVHAEFCLDHTISRFEPDAGCCAELGPCEPGVGQCETGRHDQCKGAGMCGQSNCREMWGLPGDHDGPENGFNCCTEMETRIIAHVENELPEPILVEMGVQLRSPETGEWSDVFYTSEWQEGDTLTWVSSNVPLEFSEFDAWRLVASDKHGAPRVCFDRVTVEARSLEHRQRLPWSKVGNDAYVTDGGNYCLQSPLDATFRPQGQAYATSFYWNNINDCRLHVDPCGDISTTGPCIDRLDSLMCRMTIYDEVESLLGTPADFEAIAHPPEEPGVFYYEASVDLTNNSACTGSATVLANEAMPSACLRTVPQDFHFTSDQPWHRLPAPEGSPAGVTHGLCTEGDHVIRLRDPDSPFSRVPPFTASKLNGEITFNNGFRFQGYFANDNGDSTTTFTVGTRNAETGGSGVLDYETRRYHTTPANEPFTYAFRVDLGLFGNDGHIVEFRVRQNKQRRMFCYSQIDLFRAVPTEPVIMPYIESWDVARYRCRVEHHGRLPIVRNYDELLRIFTLFEPFPKAERTGNQLWMNGFDRFGEDNIFWADGTAIDVYGRDGLEGHFRRVDNCLISIYPEDNNLAAHRVPDSNYEYYRRQNCWRRRYSVCEVESVTAESVTAESVAANPALMSMLEPSLVQQGLHSPRLNA